MTYSTLVSLEKTISQILDHGRYSISPREKERILSLNKHAISFRAYLQDFPGRSKSLEARMRDVAAEAEDILELYMMEQIRYGFRYTKWIAYLRRIKFDYKLQKVRDVMDSMAGEMVEIKNSIKIKDSQFSDSLGASSSSQVADTGKNNMVGFNEDLMKIKDQLCGYSPQLQVLPIIGMGGIGKTTLARNAYDDQLFVEHFQIRAWITISQNYSERRILLDLLDAMKEFDPGQRNGSMAQERSVEGNESLAEIPQERSVEGNESLAEIPELSCSEMAVKVYKILAGRRFLIVMDDVWSTQVLDDVKKLFPNYNNRSRIMLTTRLKDVATHANSSIPFHEMSLMDVDQSWNLLHQKVFARQDHIPCGLENIGKEIVRSCRGLPLAIVVVAGLLSTVSKTLTAWEDIAQNVKSSLATTDGQIEKILSLSYNHLPHHLRPCFLYMGGFPEDHEIKATDLIRLWVAESFLNPIVSKSFEDTAEEYLEDLVSRSLIVVTKRKSNGKIKCCSLHDTVREICIKLSREEKLLVHIVGKQAMKLMKSMKDQRRISISQSDLNSFSSTFGSTIRTLMYFQDTLGSFGSFRMLRVLNVLRVPFRSRLLPDQFFELFHLRYLAFCYDEQIPRAISNLQSLQTLIIRGSLYHPLPSEIWNMPQLRHLIISGCWLLIPNGLTFALQNLRTLQKVKNLTCSMSILNMVPNLKKLRLTFFRGSGDLLFHNLVHLCQLEKLQLELETDWRSPGDPNLVVPSSLKKLTLIGWGRYKPHINIVGPFPNLEVLKLIKFSFVERDWTTNDGDFPRLKFLLLDGSNLVQWNIVSSHFPRLKVLLLRACWRLYEIPYDIVEIPTLELIELKLCAKSLADSAKQMLEERKSYGDDAFQVRCIDCEDSNEIKELELTRSLESVRKPKKVIQRKLRKISRRDSKLMTWGVIPYVSRYYDKEVLDDREAELKIVDYKEAEIQL